MARRSGRGDDRSLTRRPARRDPLPLILVVCEGKVTEPQYLEGFRLAQRVTTVRVHVKSPGGDPQALVEAAISVRNAAAERARRERDDYLRYDQVWCVLDVDEHARLDPARMLAAAEGIELALSNPCFELWLVLHFADHGAPVNAREAGRILQKHLPGYDKHLQFDRVIDGYTEAVRRAERLLAHHDELGQPNGNPSTGVHLLTERIRGFGRDARLSAR